MLIGWFASRLVGWLVRSFVRSSIGRLVGWSVVGWLVDWLAGWSVTSNRTRSSCSDSGRTT